MATKKKAAKNVKKVAKNAVIKTARKSSKKATASKKIATVKIGTKVTFTTHGRGFSRNYTGKIIAKVAPGQLPSERVLKMAKKYQSMLKGDVKQPRNFETYLVLVDNLEKPILRTVSASQLAV